MALAVAGLLTLAAALFFLPGCFAGDAQLQQPTAVQLQEPTAGIDPTLAQGSVVASISGGLLSSNRTHLSVCVDGAAGATLSETALTAVRQVLSDIRSLPNYRPAFGEPETVEGCPAPSSLSGSPPTDAVERHRIMEQAVRILLPASPSPHRLFIYVTPPEVYAAYFGGDPYAVGTSELLCSGDVCWAVTSSLYILSASNGDTLQQGLSAALGLRPREREPFPTPDWQTCELGTPEPWCERYEDWKKIVEEGQAP